jgi:hypothetical protein
MNFRRILVWSFVAFVITNGCSYFLRSDGFAMPGTADGMVRCGFPILFWEEGGFIGLQSSFSLVAFAVDVLANIFVGVIFIRLLQSRFR